MFTTNTIEPMVKRLILTAIIFCLNAYAAAQEVVDICGQYTYYPPENISLTQAKQTALQRARIEGLMRKFNVTVYQSNTSVVSNHDGDVSRDFYSYHGSDVRGEWIEDTQQPEYKVYSEDDRLVVFAKVCGKAREIVSAGIDIEARVLRNGLTPKYESKEFNAGDDMYLLFRSPVDGYVTVWLLDRGTQTVYCLLPYRNSPQGSVQVKHDQEYLFFHQDRKLNDWQYIDEYTLTAEKALEWNEVYVVFSPNPYAKAASSSSDELALRELSFNDFSAWLTRCQSKDKDMKVSKKLIEIKKK